MRTSDAPGLNNAVACCVPRRMTVLSARTENGSISIRRRQTSTLRTIRKINREWRIPGSASLMDRPTGYSMSSGTGFPGAGATSSCF